MSALPRGYDEWRLSGPDDESEAIGTEDDKAHAAREKAMGL
jgi:hypothetical protein